LSKAAQTVVETSAASTAKTPRALLDMFLP
jgi:hypothetical protein